ncbi:MAG: tetratricopeptide repeat protein, partial [Dehalococcoidia bacterium]
MTASPTEFDYLARGQFFLQQGHTEAAIENFTAALDINQDFAAAYYYRGLAYR